jgi:hypothetical protein
MGIINKIKNKAKKVVDKVDSKLNYRTATKIPGVGKTIAVIKEETNNTVTFLKKNGPDIGRFSLNLLKNPEDLLKYAKQGLYGYGPNALYYLNKYNKILQTEINGNVIKPIKVSGKLVGNAIKDAGIAVGEGIEEAGQAIADTTMSIVNELEDFFGEFGDQFKQIMKTFKELKNVFDELANIAKMVKNAVDFKKLMDFLIKIFKKKTIQFIVLLIKIFMSIFKIIYFTLENIYYI